MASGLEYSEENRLFIDIGGLTADINLVSFYWGLNASGEWSIQFQQLGCWPEPSNRKKTAAELCGGLALQFWLSYGESIALVPQAVALTLLNLLAARAWLSYATERQRQADSSGHPLEQP